MICKGCYLPVIINRFKGVFCDFKVFGDIKGREKMWNFQYAAKK